MAYALDPHKRIHITRVFYEDGVRETLNWDTLPKDGVLMVVVIREDGSRRSMHQYDWYFQAPGLHDDIYGGTNDPTEIRRYPGAVVLQAKWGDDMTFEAVRLEAQK